MKVINLGKIVFLFFIMILIFCFSQQDGISSSSFSNNVNNWLIQIFPFIQKIPYYSYLIRKMGHILEFLVLFIALFLFFAIKKSIHDSSLYALILTFLFAIFDEFHQLFISGRCGTVTDVYIDILFPTFFSFSILLFCFKKHLIAFELKNII